MVLNIKSAWNALLGKSSPQQSREEFTRMLLGVGGASEYPTVGNFANVALLGFERNVITYKCVMMIAKGVGGLKYVLKNTKTGKVVDTHPVLDLLSKPNPMQSRSAFLSHMAADYLLDGNAFVEKVRIGANGMGVPGRLNALRPDMVTVNCGPPRLPYSFVYTPGGVGGGEAMVYPVDPITGASNVMHVLSYAPLRESSQGRGLSPVRSAWLAVLSHNAGQLWNLNLIKNGARPSGILRSDQEIPLEEVEALRGMLNDNQMGPRNSNKPMVLGGGLDWKEMSLNPVDLAFNEGMNSNARMIAIALGVPPILLNLPGDATFNNYETAKMALYEDTIVPLARQFAEEFTRWLVADFDKNLCLEIDEDAIPALEPKRAAKWLALGGEGITTINERRAKLGFEDLVDGDELLVPSNMLPLAETIDDSEDTEPDPENEDEDDESAVGA